MARYRTVEKEKVVTPKPGAFISGVRDDWAQEVGRLKLNPSKMGSIFRNADVGDTEALFEMFSAVEEDPHVYSVLMKRREAVLARKLQLSPSVESAAGERAVELCNQILFGLDGKPGIANWNDALFDMTDAIGRAFSCLQLVWDYRDGLWWPCKLEHWPQREFVIGQPYLGTRDERGTDTEKLHVLTQDEPIKGEPLEPYQWLIHVSKARSTQLHKSSLLRVVSWYYLFKHFSVRDWAIFGERYGMPYRLGKYPEGAAQATRDEVLAAVLKFGRDGGAAVPEGSSIDLIQAQVSGALPYPILAEFCDGQISKAILGGTLTTDAGYRGARALGEVQQIAESTKAERDAMMLAATIKRDVLTPVVRLNLGPNAPVPDCSFVSEEQEDLAARANRDKVLVNDIGLEVPKWYFYETYGLPKPETNDDVIGGKQPIPPQLLPEAAPDDAEEETQDDEEPLNIAASLGVNLSREMMRALASMPRDAALGIIRALKADVKKKSLAWAR